MESKWYFFPGQNERNTKISDRAHALHITSEGWNNITEHLQRTKRIQEALERERAHREGLKQGSEAMTKEWINSIENIRLKKEDERHKRINKKREDRIKAFYKIRAEQEVIRKEYVDKVKKEAFRSTGYPKDLTSALILSEVLYERENQKKFNEVLKKHDQEMKKEADAEILAADERHKQEDKEMKLKKQEEARKVGQMLKNQIEENEKNKKAAYQTKVAEETEERINAAKEEEILKEFEIDEKKKRRREIAQERKKAVENEHLRQHILAKENAEMELATRFYAEAKERIDCMMKAKEIEMRKAAIDAKTELVKKVAAVIVPSDIAENKRLKKAQAEKEEEERIKAETKAALEAQAIQDRIEDRKQYLEKLEHQKYVENELKRWEMLNRCRTKEAIEEYDHQSKKDKWAKILEYRRELLDQMAEDKEIQKREKEIDDCLSRVSFAETDKMFFEYANEVLELAKRKNRSTYPIEKVIREYKRTNGLQPKETHCRCCKK